MTFIGRIDVNPGAVSHLLSLPRQPSTERFTFVRISIGNLLHRPHPSRTNSPLTEKKNNHSHLQCLTKVKGQSTKAPFIRELFSRETQSSTPAPPWLLLLIQESNCSQKWRPRCYFPRCGLHQLLAVAHCIALLLGTNTVGPIE